jgi:hypothetical protein
MLAGARKPFGSHSLVSRHIGRTFESLYCIISHRQVRRKNNNNCENCHRSLQRTRLQPVIVTPPVVSIRRLHQRRRLPLSSPANSATAALDENEREVPARHHSHPSHVLVHYSSLSSIVIFVVQLYTISSSSPNPSPLDISSARVSIASINVCSARRAATVPRHSHSHSHTPSAPPPYTKNMVEVLPASPQVREMRSRSSAVAPACVSTLPRLLAQCA